MDMDPWERRQKILEVLCLRRHDTYRNLAHEFNVSTGTIRRDIVDANQGLKAREGGRKTAQKSRECKYVANKSHNTLLRCLRQ